MKIAVCDDEIHFLNRFCKLISKVITGEIEKIDSYSDAQALLASETVYDLIFLDIDMPELNGIDAARQFSGSDTVVIFVSSKESLVFEAYNSTDSFGFVRKDKISTDLPEVIARLQKNSRRTNYLYIKQGSGTVKIKFADIIYIEKLVNNVIIHTVQGNYSMRSTITELERELKGFGFVRTHIGYIVNLDCVSKINSKEIILSNSESVPVSRKNAKSVKYQFMRRTVSFND